MRELDDRLLRRELARRRGLRLELIAAGLKETLFDQQRAVWECPKRSIRLGVGRRGGKTDFLIKRVLYEALTYSFPPGYDTSGAATGGSGAVIPVMFPTLMMQGAKDFWSALVDLCARVGLREKADFHAQQQEKTLTILANGNKVQLRSLANLAEADKARGGKYPLAIVDEAQSVPDSSLEYLLFEALGPAFRDLNCQFIMSGTEARVHRGIWHESRHNPGYAQFSWWMGDNPTLVGDSVEWVKQFCADQGISVESSRIQREYFNRPVVDLDALVYPYDPELNAAPTSRLDPIVRVAGIDVGYRNPTARILCDYVYVPEKGYCYVLHSEGSMSEASPSRLGIWLEPWLRRSRVDMAVVDSGGAGKLAAEELIHSQGLPLVAAQKTNKVQHQAEMAELLRSGVLLVDESASGWVDEAASLVWDDATGKEADDGSPRDILDAALYAFRHCRMLSKDREAWSHSPTM